MRNIDSIIVHCSATKAGQDFTATDIDRWHRERGFNGIGYHYVIRLDGKLEKGRDVALPGAHSNLYNEHRPEKHPAPFPISHPNGPHSDTRYR